MEPPILERFSVTDSRGVEWKVVYSGPTMAGSAPPGMDITRLPAIYFARFEREGVDREITIDLRAHDATPEELLRLLESSPEWEHEARAKP